MCKPCCEQKTSVEVSKCIACYTITNKCISAPLTAHCTLPICPAPIHPTEAAEHTIRMPFVLPIEADKVEMREGCARPQDAGIAAGYNCKRPVCGPMHGIAAITVCAADVQHQQNTAKLSYKCRPPRTPCPITVIHRSHSIRSRKAGPVKRMYKPTGR